MAALTIPGASAVAEEPAPRGIVRAVDEASLSSDLGVPVIALPLREGDAFDKDALLVAFDCASLEADRRSAQAKYDVERLGFESSQKLAAMKAAGRFEVETARAKAADLKAQVEALDIRLKRCEIRAPFAGRVAELRVRAHEVPDRGQPLMRIVGTASLEIDMIVPSAWLKWLAVGTPFTVTLDETGVTAKAEIVRVGATVDAVSQTVKVVGRFAGKASDILPGMSGAAAFVVPNG